MRLKHILCYVNQIKAKKYEKRVDFIRVYVVNYFSMKNTHIVDCVKVACFAWVFT